MDILRALLSPAPEVRKKTLDIAMDLLTHRNVDEVVGVLKKELMKTQNKSLERGVEYRQVGVRGERGGGRAGERWMGWNTGRVRGVGGALGEEVRTCRGLHSTPPSPTSPDFS